MCNLIFYVVYIPFKTYIFTTRNLNLQTLEYKIVYYLASVANNCYLSSFRKVEKDRKQ